VETCIQQLTSCAVESKALNDTNVPEQNMIVDIPEIELGERQRKFERAIAVLNELLKGYRAKPRYPPGVNIVIGHGENRKVLGTPIVITIRGYNQGSAMPVSISSGRNKGFTVADLCYRFRISIWEASTA